MSYLLEFLVFCDRKLLFSMYNSKELKVRLLIVR